MGFTALGGLAAAMLLLPGASAKADELADLRANQELLQQRIDQLAQIPGAGGLYQGPGGAKTAGQGIVGGSFPRSFLIPGTDTSIRVGGAIRFHIKHNFNGGAVHAVPATSTNFGNNGDLQVAPLHQHVALVGGALVKAGNPARSQGDDVTFFSPQQSKVNFETRTPTAWGEARTFMEFDWAGGCTECAGSLRSTNSIAPRLRFAYATLGGLLGGQANSNFSDPDADPENINFGGPPGSPGVTRIPQLRYTWPLAPWGWPGAFSVAAEAPETESWLPTGGLASSDSPDPAGGVNPFKAASPDVTFAWYIPQPWGHADFSAVVRPAMQMKDGLALDRTFTGWGLHFGGDYKPGWFGWSKDDITWQFEGGDGIGRYLGGNTTMISIITNYPAARPTLATVGNVRARTVWAWGGNTSYKHYWTPTLRSNAVFGIQHMDINNLGGADGFVCSGAGRFTGGGGCGLNKELVYSAVNLIWNPVPFADLSLEYVWGHRQVLSNLKGDVNGIIGAFRVNF
ncbi:MAG: porin [Thiohalocapsa sp.]